jgi:hypothetical protein
LDNGTTDEKAAEAGFRDAQMAGRAKGSMPTLSRRKAINSPFQLG